MNQYNIITIRNTVEKIITDARNLNILFTTIKIDKLEYMDKEITVKGKYKSSEETGQFEIIFNKNLDPIKIAITTGTKISPYQQYSKNY